MKENRQAMIDRRSWILGVLVVLLGLAMSIMASRHHAQLDVVAQQEKFTRSAAVAHHAISQQVMAGSHLARAVQAALSSGQEISERELRRTYLALNPKSVLPGLQAISYARRVQGVDGGKDRYVVEFALPLEGNESLIGMDLSTHPENMKALEQAHAVGTPVLTEPFVLVQDQVRGRDSVDGMVIRVPVYAAGESVQSHGEAVGSIGISFRITGMIDEAIARGEGGQLAVSVADITDGAPVVVYSKGRAHPGMSRSQDVAMGGRQWRVTISPLAGELEPSWWPTATLLAGSSISLLLGLLAFNLVGTREKARLLALDMTQKYQESEERFRILNEHLPGMVLLADDDGMISYVNKAGRRMLGLQKQENMGSLMELFNLPHLLPQIQARPEHTPYLTLPRIRLHAISGKPFWASLSFAVVQFKSQSYILALGSDVSDIIDLSEQLELQSKQLHFQATHDQLTGLPNRRDFEARLAAAIADNKKGGPVPTLLYVDLDQFKIINDTAGHMAGDRLLMAASEGLRGILQENEAVARLGGDEFGILIPGASRQRAIDVAEAIRSFFDGFNFNWEGTDHQVTCSIGLARLQPGQSKEDIMAEADAACYMAKEKGRNRWHSSENDVESIARRVEMAWVARIRSAMAEDRLRLYYQDILPIDPRAAVGDGAHFEVLLRLHEADGALVPAGEFIPAAERYGLMGMIDRWTVDTALRNFRSLHPSRRIAMCAINLSGQTISDPSFEPYLLDAISRWRVPASCVCLEITETAAINNMDRMMGFIPRLRAMGFKIALDDFGAGMSSFGYLKTLQSDIIKIDGSFVRDMEHDVLSQSIIQAVTDISHKMGMQVVAEWVGSKRAVEQLGRLGVDFGQGFFLARPQPCPIPFSALRSNPIIQKGSTSNGS